MIFIDLDDVLVDFSGGLKARGITNEASFIHKPRTEWTPEQIELDRLVVSAMNEPGFFRNLLPLSGCGILWGSAWKYGTPGILTAYPNVVNDKDRVIQEKIEWVEEYLGKASLKNFVACARSEKKNFAIDPVFERPNVLVDDLEANCNEWTSHGGCAIQYTDTTSAINQLHKVMNV